MILPGPLLEALAGAGVVAGLLVVVVNRVVLQTHPALDVAAAIAVNMFQKNNRDSKSRPISSYLKIV
jgi:hypothetical protein